MGKHEALVGSEEEDVVIPGNGAAPKCGEADRAWLALKAGSVATSLCFERNTAPTCRRLAE